MIVKLLMQTHDVCVCRNERKINMTANELRAAMESAAAAKSEEYAKKLAELDKDAKTELKALKISCNIADICKKFTSFFLGKDYYYSKREAVVSATFLSRNFEDFAGYMKSYKLMSEEQKELFLVYAYPVMSVRHNFIDNRKANIQSESITENEAESRFEADIIKGVAGEIIEQWARLWEKYGFPAEKAGKI